MSKVNVTKSYLPPIDEYITKIKDIWDSHYLTNFGKYNNELEIKIKEYLNIENVHLVNNGTIALLLALECLDLHDCEIITTPFSFIATASSIVWQKCKPVFVDIENKHFNIDCSKIEEKINSKTKAIMVVHCFGFPCDVEQLEEIGKNNSLYVIYDAAHAFGIKYKTNSLLSYGDISCCSLHATKIFHTVEGGLCVVNNAKYNNKMNAIKNFGNDNGEYNYIGINAKNSEFHSAMGLCVLEHLDDIIQKRKTIYEKYKEQLQSILYIPKLDEDFQYNYIYFPVLFENEKELLEVFKELNIHEIYPKRYFYPCLSQLNIFEDNKNYPVTQNISERIACLPLDTYLEDETIDLICNIIKDICRRQR